MAITKPPVLPAWAETATPTTDIVQPSDAEISAGWPLSTTPPARQRFNWVLNFCANAVRYFCRYGVPDYDAAETYATNAIIRGDDGKIYRSKVDSNIGHTPSTSSTQWGSPTVPTPAADDNSSAIANTAYVLGQISVSMPVMDGTAAVGTSNKFARADHVHPSDTTKANTTGTYLSMTVGAAASAAACPFTGITGKPTTCAGYGITDAITTATIGSQSVAFATNAGRAYPKRSDGTSIDINWSGQAGQPTWLVGSNDGVNFYVYNPANFHVNQADVAVTQPAGTNNTSIATTAFVNNAVTPGFIYTPTGSAGTNVSGLSVGQAFVTRSGNIVEVTGQVSVTTPAGGQFTLDLSLPIASNLTASTDLSGTSALLISVTVLNPAHISANVAGDSAHFSGTASSGAGTYDVRYTYSYVVK